MKSRRFALSVDIVAHLVVFYTLVWRGEGGEEGRGGEGTKKEMKDANSVVYHCKCYGGVCE